MLRLVVNFIRLDLIKVRTPSNERWINVTNHSNFVLFSLWKTDSSIPSDLTDLTQEEGYSIQVDGVEAEVRSRLRSENFSWIAE